MPRYRPRPVASAWAEEIKEHNARYHDLAAYDYDDKWGISYGGLGRAQVLGKVRRALGEEATGLGRVHAGVEVRRLAGLQVRCVYRFHHAPIPALWVGIPFN